MLHRTLYTLGTGAYPDTLPEPDTTDVVQVDLHVEYVKGSSFAGTLEAFGAYAVNPPHGPNRGWLFLERGRYAAGVAAVAALHSDFGLTVAAGVVAMTGLTLVLTPRIAYEPIDGLELELGSIIVEGPPPPLAVTPQIALGTLYDTIDQVFAGVRFSL
jgi:hypothetical protein